MWGSLKFVPIADAEVATLVTPVIHATFQFIVMPAGLSECY